MTTLKKIGAELGLSPATVSRALNGFPEVNAETRKLVEQTAKRLNYSPNRIAQKLVTGRSGMVGMIVRVNPASPADRSFVEIMMGLSSHLAERDLDLVFQVGVDTNPILPYERMLQKSTVDGFILNAPTLDDPRIDYLSTRDIPFVVHGRATHTATHPYFDIDNAAVTRDSVEHLANLGHRKIALLSGLETAGYAAARGHSFAQAMAAKGFSGSVRNALPSEDYGHAAAIELLRAQDRPTAIIADSTLIAAGVYTAAAELGLSIPDDISVIAHDDDIPQWRAVNFEPALTVTRAPMRDACAPLAQILAARLGLGPEAPLQQTQRAELIIRGSAGYA